ncbi:MAG: hypothetical protein R3D43_11525 [Tepidamorphaceae bacterium]
MMASIAANIEQLEKAISGEITATSDEAALEPCAYRRSARRVPSANCCPGLGGMSPEDRQVNGPLINS